jgi:hypothetical protein
MGAVVLALVGGKAADGCMVSVIARARAVMEHLRDQINLLVQMRERLAEKEKRVAADRSEAKTRLARMLGE